MTVAADERDTQAGKQVEALPGAPTTTETNFLCVAVYWPREFGYGCPERVANMEQARARVEDMVRGGYGTGASRIHVIRTRTTRELSEWPFGEAAP